MSGQQSASRSPSAAGAAGRKSEQEVSPAGSGFAEALPGGTVTFAFTDIEASTGLLKRLDEERYARLLDEHRQIIRSSFYAADGIEIDRQGDACFFALPRAKEAVRAAVEIQQKHDMSAWPEDLRVRVRIGLHTGEPNIGASGYIGVDVVKGARICSLARGRQVLLSASTYALTASTLPPDVTAESLGHKQLKGIDEPEHLYQLVIAEPSRDADRSPRPGIPAGWEHHIEERFGTVGAGVARRISDKIAQSLPRDPTQPTWEAVKNESLERLAARAAHSLNTKIHEGTAAAIKKARQRSTHPPRN